MKKLIFGAVFCFLLFVTIWYQKNPPTSSVTIRGRKIFVELAISPEERQKGLGYRDRLASDHGMLFLLGEPAYHGFWMKGMRFPLDFIWINEKTVVDITENVPNPVGNEQPVSLKPQAPADKVLEVNAGVVSASGISVGDTVSFKN